MHEITNLYPKLHFTPHDRFIYSPSLQTVFYDESQTSTDQGKASLLHEIGHAHYEHNSYSSDIELLNMEVEAWIFARNAAGEMGLKVDDAHIHNCLESYRFWLYKRSRCPECEHHGIQTKPTRYRCFICLHQWKVSLRLSLRPRRLACLPL